MKNGSSVGCGSRNCQRAGISAVSSNHGNCFAQINVDLSDPSGYVPAPHSDPEMTAGCGHVCGQRGLSSRDIQDISITLLTHSVQMI